MALILADRIKETTLTTGTGTYTLAGAVTGFQSFAAVGNGNTCYYCATNGTDWEVGIGTYASSGTTLARTTIIASSNSNNAVSWAAGAKDVFVTLPASKFAGTELANTFTQNQTFQGDLALGTGSDITMTTGNILSRTSGVTNTGTKEPHGVRVDRIGTDISAGFGAFQSLIQSGTSATGAANTDWPMVGTADLITMSGWCLNWSATPLLKNLIPGNFGTAFENISTNAAQVVWSLELDVGNYTGTGSAGDQRYGVGLALNAFGAASSAVSEGIAIMRSSANSGTGFTRGILMTGVRDKGITFEAMTDSSSTLTILDSKISGDSVSRFTVEEDGDMAWGPGNAAVDTSLSRATSGGIQTSAAAPFTITNTTDNGNVQVAVIQGDRATPADGDTAYVSLALSNDGGTQAEFARLGWQATDVTSGTDIDGAVFVSTPVAGVLATQIVIGNNAFRPGVNDAVALGSTGLQWSDLFLSSGAVINFNNGDVTITHSADTLTVAGGTFTGSSVAAATTTAQGAVELATDAETITGTDTGRALTPSNLTAFFANGQLKFPATQNPSADANTLDDYEEGTWTPGMTFNNDATGVTYSLQQGIYTKIGRIVHIQGRITLTSNGSGVGAARITGLPFTPNVIFSTGDGVLIAGGSAATGIKPRVQSSTSEILLLIPGATADAAATDTNCTDTFDYMFSATYSL